MNRLDETPSTSAGLEKPLVDLPLRLDSSAPFSQPLSGARKAVSEESPDVAGLVCRAGAFVADAAAILLIWAVAVLAAGLARGQMPPADGWPWAAAFLLLLSFFATVPALILFGKTVGMSLAGLVPRRDEAGRRLAAREAVRRWLGTLGTAATLGIVLVWTSRTVAAPTPADRLSGRTLLKEDVES